MRYENPLGQFTKSRSVDLDFGSCSDIALSSCPQSSSSSIQDGSASTLSFTTLNSQPLTGTDKSLAQHKQPQKEPQKSHEPKNQQLQRELEWHSEQQLQQTQQDQQKQQKQSRQRHLKHLKGQTEPHPTNKKASDRLDASIPSYEPIKIINPPPFTVDPIKNDTADTADIASDSPKCNSSSEPSRLARVSQKRLRRSMVTLEIDTHIRHYPSSPYRTPTRSPESLSGSHDDDLATCESLRVLSPTTLPLNPLSTRATTTTKNPDVPSVCASPTQGPSPTQRSMLLQSPEPLTLSVNPLPIIPQAIQKADLPCSNIVTASIPRKRGRPPKSPHPSFKLSPTSTYSSGLFFIASDSPLDGETNSNVLCSTLSVASTQQMSSDIYSFQSSNESFTTDARNMNVSGQTTQTGHAKPIPPRLKHNRKPNPDGAIWSVAELAAETSAERRPARALVYADELQKKLIEENKICIMEPCFRTPIREDLYCVGHIDGETGMSHRHGDNCIHGKTGCRIVLAFRYRYQLRLDLTYLAWVTAIDMATIPLSIIKEFSVTKEATKQALETETRMAEQYRQLFDEGYFTSRKEEKRAQYYYNPNVVLDGWSIAYQNKALMASKSNRLGFLQWVAQAYQMAKGDKIQAATDTTKRACSNPLDIVSSNKRDPSITVGKDEPSLVGLKKIRMKSSSS
ncbi:hypothetical protein FBU30_000394 [Linnemannia zychae]|nr:hypothetical protein FBU30_000394 [Linnemannia zychae]